MFCVTNGAWHLTAGCTEEYPRPGQNTVSSPSISFSLDLQAPSRRLRLPDHLAFISLAVFTMRIERSSE